MTENIGSCCCCCCGWSPVDEMTTRTSQPPSNLRFKTFCPPGEEKYGKFMSRKISSVAEEISNPGGKVPKESYRVTSNHRQIPTVTEEASRLRSTSAKAFTIGQTVIGRTSLLGRPVSARSHRRDVRYRRLQAKAYNFLERPKDWQALSYHLVVLVVLFISFFKNSIHLFSTEKYWKKVKNNTTKHYAAQSEPKRVPTFSNIFKAKCEQELKKY